MEIYMCIYLFQQQLFKLKITCFHMLVIKPKQKFGFTIQRTIISPLSLRIHFCFKRFVKVHDGCLLKKSSFLNPHLTVSEYGSTGPLTASCWPAVLWVAGQTSQHCSCLRFRTISFLPGSGLLWRFSSNPGNECTMVMVKMP